MPAHYASLRLWSTEIPPSTLPRRSVLTPRTPFGWFRDDKTSEGHVAVFSPRGFPPLPQGFAVRGDIQVSINALKARSSGAAWRTRPNKRTLVNTWRKLASHSTGLAGA